MRRNLPSHLTPWVLSAAAGALLAAGPALADSPTQVSEVVVTAEKRAENIQQTPLAVSAVSTELLNQIHATALTDIGAYVPALQIDSGGTPGQTLISIRGIAPIGPGATVATYLDDTPIGSSSAYGGGVAFMLDLLPYDIDRIEVLRGPQGTLYGASSMGGLLKYVLSTPSLTDFHAQAGADVFGLAGASQPGGGFRGSLSGPLIKDHLAATASFAIEETPGFINNPLLGVTGQNAYRQESARVGLLWAPVSNLTIKINAFYSDIKADGDGNVALDPATLQPIIGPNSDNNLRAQPFTKALEYYAGTLTYKMGWADFISATSYSDTSTHQTVDESYIFGIAFPFFGFPVGTSQSQYVLRLKKFTQEFRLQSPSGSRLEWLVGAFFDNEVSTNDQSPDARTQGGAIIAPINPIFAAQLPSTYTEYALFSDLTFHLTDKFSILGGVRYSEDYQTFSQFVTSALLGDVDLPNQKSHEGVTTYSAGAEYRFNPDVMVYGRVASGYQPGGPNLSVPGVPSTFEADTLTNYELGLKSQFLSDRVLLDVDAFDIQWNNIQLLANSNGVTFGANGGRAASRGVEGNVSIKPISHLQLDGTFAYVDAVLTQDAPAISGLSGDRLPYIPRYSGSVRASYEWPVFGDWSANLGAGLRLVGARFSQVNSAPTSFELRSYAVLDLNATLSNGRYALRFFAKNVTNRDAYLTYNVLQNGATNAVTQIEAAVLQPRVLGLAIDAKF